MAIKHIIYYCLWKHHVNLLLQSFRSVYYYSTDENPGLRIESFAVINLRGVSTNNSIILNEDWFACIKHKRRDMSRLFHVRDHE